MHKPNLVNIDRFKKKLKNVNKPSMTLTTQELKMLDSDIDELYKYTIELQHEIIRLREQDPISTKIDINGGDFY